MVPVRSSASPGKTLLRGLGPIALLGGAAAGIALAALAAVRAGRPPGSGTVAHHPGENCLVCHAAFRAAGTVFRDSSGTATSPGAEVVFIDPDGGEYGASTDAAGNLAVAGLPDGRYLVRLNSVTSRTWHVFPGQAGCNVCHVRGGNGSPPRAVALHPYHTRLPPDNDCRGCHHFPASQTYAALKTTGVLEAGASDPPLPTSRVDILGRVFEFDPADHVIRTTRPDIFAPGYFSMFDVILAVAKKNGISISYRFDLKAMTSFIRRIDGLSGPYWYRFSYDAGAGRAQELNSRRANRWDEALWRPGVWIKVVAGEAVEDLKAEFVEEISRERHRGHIVPDVRISLNPSNYLGNPPGSGRVTVSRVFADVEVRPHGWRSAGRPSPVSKPFQPGVVTSLDILLSLQDEGALDLVTGMFYTFFAGHYIDSYYVTALGFPGVGTAHASGRQGFIYTTENGAPGRLPNNADGKLHIMSDIHVIHAPDFSSWRWAELGNPYYESRAPGYPALLAASVDEDYEAVGRGFNLHQPVLRGRTLHTSFNLFDTAPAKLFIRRPDGRPVATLFETEAADIGIRKTAWEAGNAPPGKYELVFLSRGSVQTRTFEIPPRR
ncbi:MAG: carboxypeptidase regulatory-like domain-containing protein [Candidatus Aminicenantes bacterium]|nr:carboxypeptidase regulatory-like domain-containing protein [Candidatus Aminicenantes bacterium]